MALKNAVFYATIIAISFLWAGSAYISQMYRLYGLLPPEQVDIIALRWNYGGQVIGILVFVASQRYLPAFLQSKKIYAAGLLAAGGSALLMLTSTSVPVIVGAGLFFNLMIGIYSAWHLSMLAAFIPQQIRGRTYGFAYAAGSIGTWLISLVSGGQLLSSPYVSILYCALMMINFLLVSGSRNLPMPTAPSSLPAKTEDIKGFSPYSRSLFLFLSVLFLMSLLHSIGAQYHSASLVESKVNLEYTRAYYAIGLIAAGFLFDKSRKYGAVACLASLLFPFVAVIMHSQDSLIAISWIANYLLLGVFSVFRAVLFADIAGKDYSLLPLAGLGLLAGRMGEIANTFISGKIENDPLMDILLLIGLFILLLFLFIAMFQKLYMAKVPVTKSKEILYEEFETRYALTGRERDVFRQLVQGYSNTEISSILFVSESTVKFHIKHILRKTGCTNRTEVIDRLRRMGD